MATMAIVAISLAEENREVAAVHAFPVNLSFAMLLTGCLTCTDRPQRAVSAPQVFFGGFLIVSIDCCSLLAVDEATEVGLLALMALIEGAAMHGVLQRLAKEGISFVVNSAIGQDALELSIL